MNSLEAKKILLAHRPGGTTAQDADVIAALRETCRDPALQEWWRQQQSFHAAMERAFAKMPVPNGLREQALARAKILPFPWWRRPKVWAAAAALVVLLGFAALLSNPAADDSFATFRSRMTRAVLRQYRMDIETNDLARIRQFLATNNAPADFTLPRGLAQLPPVGAGVLSWQAGHASMVCLDSGAQGTLFLFVADRSAVRQPPPATREFAQVKELMTVSWTEGGKVYVLAGTGARQTLERYF